MMCKIKKDSVTMLMQRMFKVTYSKLLTQSKGNTQYIFLLRLLTFCVMISRE